MNKYVLCRFNLWSKSWILENLIHLFLFRFLAPTQMSIACSAVVLCWHKVPLRLTGILFLWCFVKTELNFQKIMIDINFFGVANFFTMFFKEGWYFFSKFKSLFKLVIFINFSLFLLENEWQIVTHFVGNIIFPTENNENK